MIGGVVVGLYRQGGFAQSAGCTVSCGLTTAPLAVNVPAEAVPEARNPSKATVGIHRKRNAFIDYLPGLWWASVRSVVEAAVPGIEATAGKCGGESDA